jgi:hypothetical protein
VRRILIACLCILALSIDAPVSASHRLVRRTDPRGDAQPDVWRTTRANLHESRPHRIRFKLFGNLGPDWQISVWVDSRGGPRAEYRLWNFEDLGTSGCGGKRLSDREAIDLRCGRRQVECCFVGTLWWNMPRPELNPNKRFRWRIHTHYFGFPDATHDDLAPDRGWYS